MSKITHYFHTHGIEAKGFKDLVMHFTGLAVSTLMPKTSTQRFFAYLLILANIVIAVLFICFAFAEKYQLTSNPFYGRLEFSFIDGGYPERFGYVLELLIAFFFLARALSTRAWFWLSWSAVFIIIFLDDFLKLHETIPLVLTGSEDSFIFSSDLIGFLFFLPIILLILSVGFYFCPPQGRSYELFLLFVGYLGFLIILGVGLDFIHPILAETFGISETLLTLIEDGGELVILTCLTLTSACLFLEKKI